MNNGKLTIVVATTPGSKITPISVEEILDSFNLEPQTTNCKFSQLIDAIPKQGIVICSAFDFLAAGREERIAVINAVKNENVWFAVEVTHYEHKQRVEELGVWHVLYTNPLDKHKEWKWRMLLAELFARFIVLTEEQRAAFAGVQKSDFL